MEPGSTVSAIAHCNSDLRLEVVHQRRVYDQTPAPTCHFSAGRAISAADFAKLYGSASFT